MYRGGMQPTGQLTQMLQAYHLTAWKPDQFMERQRAEAEAAEALARYLVGLRAKGDVGEISEEMVRVVEYARWVLANQEDHWETRAKMDSFQGLSVLLVVTWDVPTLPGRAELMTYLEEWLRQVWGEGADKKVKAWRRRVNRQQGGEENI